MSRSDDPKPADGLKSGSKPMKLDLSDSDITCARDSAGVVGPDEILLDRDDNLLEGTDFETEGYIVAPFLSSDQWANLEQGIRKLIRDSLIEAGAEVPETYRLEDYHRYIAGNQERHMQVVRPMAQGLPLERMNIDPDLIAERIGELLGKRLTLAEPPDGQKVFCMRAVRPHSRDNNPLHRDAWLPHLRNAVNLYVPMAGSNERSSLSLVPGSHHWSEAETARTEGGAKIDSVKFSVPSLVAASRPVNVLRPNPGANEVLLFSPYVLHGGATNLNPDATRVSLEIRLWRAEE
jgi:hypothetical protein